MNPLYTAIIASVAGRKRRCPVCGKEQVVNYLDAAARYHCKKCGHVFTEQELKQPSRHAS